MCKGGRKVRAVARGRPRADADAGWQNGYTPVNVAAQNGHLEVVVKLAELGADIHKPTNVRRLRPPPHHLTSRPRTGS